jgi:hypothetical protein
VPRKLANLITDVLQPSAKLLDCPDPSSDEIQFVGIGGFPTPRRGERWLQTRDELRARIVGLAEDALEDRGQVWPSGLATVWSPTVDRTPDQYIRIPAIRVFPIHGYRVRHFIDQMLATEDEPISEPLALPIR